MPSGGPWLPPGMATKVAMKSTWLEACLFVMNSRLPAAKTRDRQALTHIQSLQNTHSDCPIVRGPCRERQEVPGRAVFCHHVGLFIIQRRPACHLNQEKVNLTHKLLYLKQTSSPHLEVPLFSERKNGGRAVLRGVGTTAVATVQMKGWSSAQGPCGNPRSPASEERPAGPTTPAAAPALGQASPTSTQPASPSGLLGSLVQSRCWFHSWQKH